MNTKIKQALTGVAVLGAMAAATLQSVPSQAAPFSHYKHPYSVNHREARQQHRIFQGIHHDSLTYREAGHLESREASIARAEARDRRSGGKFTWRERHNIEQRENHASHAIYVQKHDRQHR